MNTHAYLLKTKTLTLLLHPVMNTHAYLLKTKTLTFYYFLLKRHLPFHDHKESTKVGTDNQK